MKYLLLSLLLFSACTSDKYTVQHADILYKNAYDDLVVKMERHYKLMDSLLAHAYRSGADIGYWSGCLAAKMTYIKTGKFYPTRERRFFDSMRIESALPKLPL